MVIWANKRFFSGCGDLRRDGPFFEDSGHNYTTLSVLFEERLADLWGTDTLQDSVHDYINQNVQMGRSLITASTITVLTVMTVPTMFQERWAICWWTDCLPGSARNYATHDVWKEMGRLLVNRRSTRQCPSLFDPQCLKTDPGRSLINRPCLQDSARSYINHNRLKWDRPKLGLEPAIMGAHF